MPAELVVVKGENRGDFVKIVGEVIVGRADDADLTLDADTKVSSHHAKITAIGPDRFLLEDLGSTNGTYVNKERIEQVPLRSGDLIKIGRSLLVFRADGSFVSMKDIALVGGGTSQSLARRDAGVEKAATSSAVLPRPGQDSSEQSALSAALQDLVVAAGEVELQRGFERALETVREATDAKRGLLFLRHPLTGGLGCAASSGEGGDVHAPVDPDVLSKAVSGEVVALGNAAAAPVRILGFTAGAVFVDGCAKEVATNLSALTAAGVLLGLTFGLHKSRRLAGSASEIVALATSPVSVRAIDVSAQIHASERLYAVVAARRGLAWECDVPQGLVAKADPLLLGRGLDKLVEHVLDEARGRIQIMAHSDSVRLVIQVRHGTSDNPAVLAAQLDPAGVAADLRRAGETFDDGVLAVARVALMRAGARFSIVSDPTDVVFSVELEATGSSPGL